VSDYNPNHPAPGGSQSWGQSSPHLPSANVQATMSQMTEQLQTVIDAAERAAEAIRYDAEDQARQHLAEAQRKADRLTAERVGLISDLTDDLIRHASTVRDHSEQMIRALEDAISSVTGKLEQPALTDPLPSFAAEPSTSGDTFASSLPPLSQPEPPAPSYETYASPAPAEPPPAAYEPPAPAYDPPSEPMPPIPPPSQAEAPLAPPTEPPATTPGFGPPPTPADEMPPPAGPPATPSPAPGAPLSEDALLHATRLAVAGEDRETIAAALRDEYGVTDPEPVVARVLGEA
jgi:vacuolar-type H+-ATPase subunit H